MAKTKPFEEHYNQYEQWFEKNRYAYESELHAVQHFIPLSGEGVEIGIGSGKFAAPLGIRRGIEPSQAMLSLAEERGLIVYDARAEDLPFENERFDFALMVTTICFVDDAPQSIREIHRILKPDGTVIIGFVDSESPLGKTYEKHKEKNVFYRDAVFYSTEEVLKLLRENGFGKPEMVQTVFGDLSQIDMAQDFTEGHGEGGFVVVKAAKTGKV